MIHYITLISLVMLSNPIIIFKFSEHTDLSLWQVVDDVVMGGRSQGYFDLNEDGNGVFKGEVSLANNGGFSSVRHRFKQKNISGATQILLRVKGDGQKYQFRLKTHKNDNHAYVFHFTTSNDWETIQIDLKEMYPVFRGRLLDLPNYSAKEIGEISLMIANKKAQKFQVLIDEIIIQ